MALLCGNCYIKGLSEVNCSLFSQDTPLPITIVGVKVLKYFL